MKRICLFLIGLVVALFLSGCVASNRIQTQYLDKNPHLMDTRISLTRIDLTYLQYGFATGNRMIIGPIAQPADFYIAKKALQAGFVKAFKRHQMNSLVEVSTEAEGWAISGVNIRNESTNQLTLTAQKHLAGWNGQILWQITMGPQPLWMSQMDGFKLSGDCHKNYLVCADNFAESLIVYMKANHLISPKSMAEIPSPGDQ